MQSSGEVVQLATTQTFDCNVSQWLAWKPWQSVSLVQGVPKPVGPGVQAGRVSPVVQGTQSLPD